MKDIKGAIQAEDRYLLERLAFENDVSIYDFLAPYGYTSLDEYQKDKKDFVLTQSGMIIYLTDMLAIEDRVEAHVRAQVPSVFIPTAECQFAWVGVRDEIDMSLFEQYGVRPYNMRYIGGTIISGPEDFSIAIITPSVYGLTCNYYTERIGEFLSKYFDNVEVTGNDILIDGKKIAGAVSREVNDVFLFATQISFKDRTEVINVLCPPHGDKTPGCIDSSVLSRDELQAEILSWFEAT